MRLQSEKIAPISTCYMIYVYAIHSLSFEGQMSGTALRSGGVASLRGHPACLVAIYLNWPISLFLAKYRLLAWQYLEPGAGWLVSLLFTSIPRTQSHLPLGFGCFCCCFVCVRLFFVCVGDVHRTLRELWLKTRLVQIVIESMPIMSLSDSQWLILKM